MNKREAYKILRLILDKHGKGRKLNINTIWMKILFWINNLEALIAFIQKSQIDSNEDQLETLCWEGIVRFLSQDYREALIAFKKAERLHRGIPELHYLLAKCYFELLELHNAEIYYRHLMINDALKSLGYYGYGCCMFKRERYDEALAFINRALDCTNSDYLLDMLNKKGLCLMKQNKLEDALSCFKRCLHLSPQAMHIKENLALTLSKLGEHEEASKYYRELLKKAPYDIITINNLSLCLSAQGKHEEALKYCNMGLKIDPINGDLLANKSGVLYYLGDYAKALECIYEAEKTIKEDIGLLNNKALCLMQLDKTQEALKICDELLSLGQYSSEMLLNRAFCLVKNQQYEEALRCLSMIEEKGERLYDIYTLYGTCFEKIGDNDKAVEFFNKAIKFAG